MLFRSDVLTLYPSGKHHTDASHPHTSTHLRALWTFSLPRADTWLLSPPTFSFFPVTLPALPQTLRLLLSVEEMSPLEGSEPLASPLKGPFPGPSFPLICSSPPLPPARQSSPPLSPCTAKLPTSVPLHSKAPHLCLPAQQSSPLLPPCTAELPISAPCTATHNGGLTGVY